MDQLKAPPALAMADGTHLPPGELVATFTDRKEVNKAIEFLASQKFPVHSLYVAVSYTHLTLPTILLV